MPRLRTRDELPQAMFDYRTEHGLTQEGAAEAAGVGLPVWARAERGVTFPILKYRVRIEHLLPPLGEEPFSTVVQTIDDHQRKARTMPPSSGPTHRHDLSTGLIKCQVVTTRMLPAAAYAILAELVEALSAANDKLMDIIGDDG